MAQIARYDELNTAVLRELPAGANPADLAAALSTAGRRFFKDTKVWEQDIGPFNLVADQEDYVLTAGWDATIHQIQAVRLNDAAGVTAGTLGILQNLDNIDYNPANATLTLPLAPTTAVTSGLEFRAILVPTLRSEELPQDLLNSFADGIVWGAVAYLTGSKAHPARYDAETFARASREYRSEVGKAVRLVAGAYMQGNIQIRPKWGFIE